MWFDEQNQYLKLLSYLPPGRLYRQAWIENSNFGKLIGSFAKTFQWCLEQFNKTFRSGFILKSEKLFESMKKDYGIPDDIFYESKAENKTDIYVKRYLMRGNTAWHYEAIANIYGLKVKISPYAKYFSEEFGLPHKIPTKIVNHTQDYILQTVSIVFDYSEAESRLPHTLPHILTNNEKIKKVQGIIKAIAPAYQNIIFDKLDKGVSFVNYKFDRQFPKEVQIEGL